MESNSCVFVLVSISGVREQQQQQQQSSNIWWACKGCCQPQHLPGQQHGHRHGSTPAVISCFQAVETLTADSEWFSRNGDYLDCSEQSHLLLCQACRCFKLKKQKRHCFDSSQQLLCVLHVVITGICFHCRGGSGKNTIRALRSMCLLSNFDCGQI